MSLAIVINGQNRSFDNIVPPTTLDQVVGAMDLKGDRVAVEHNGRIIQRTQWEETSLASGDRLEIVHFVGGG